MKDNYFNFRPFFLAYQLKTINRVFKEVLME